MQTGNAAFLQILRINQCEFWQIKDETVKRKSKGVLQVLHSESLDLFILRIEGFKFALVKDLYVVGIDSAKEGVCSYIFPTLHGSDIIKIISRDQEVTIENFETVLENTTHFVHKSGVEGCLTLEQTHQAEDIIEKGSPGGKGFRRLTNRFSKVIAPTKNESHANQKIHRSFSELKTCEGRDILLVDIPREEAKSLTEAAREIALTHKEIPAEEQRKPFRVDPNVEKWYTEISSKLDHGNERADYDEMSTVDASFVTNDSQIRQGYDIRSPMTTLQTDFSKINTGTDIN